MKIKNLKLKIYGIVSQIPKGKVATYGQIAKKLMVSPRLVGRVLHENTDPKTVLCHRVVFSDGSLSTNYAFGGEKEQRKRLISEGIKIRNEKVDLKRYFYENKK